MSQFIHLHNHTHYSLLDGAATVETLLKAAADNNMPAVALTDLVLCLVRSSSTRKQYRKK